MYYLKKSYDSLKRSCDLKIHVEGLFTCHVVGRRKIPPNRVGGKLFPLIYTSEAIYHNRARTRENSIAN